MKKTKTNIGRKALVSFVLFAAPGVVAAGTAYWNGADDLHSKASLWNSGVVPGPGDIAINNSGATVTIASDWTLEAIQAGTDVVEFGHFVQTAGKVTLSGSLLLGGEAWAEASYSLNGGTLITHSVESHSQAFASIILNGGVLRTASTSSGIFISPNISTLAIQANSALTADVNITLVQSLTGTGTFNKLGAGRLTLAADSLTFQGGVTIGAGTLDIGTSELRVAQQVVVGVGGTLAVSIEDAQNYGKIVSTQGASLVPLFASGLQVVFTDPSQISVGDTFNIFSGGTVGGFGAGNVALSSNVAGFELSFGSNGVLTVTAIPEPSTYALLGGAVLLGGVVLRRRRR